MPPTAPIDCGPSFLVTPRYLAGDDGTLAQYVTETLEKAAWSCWTTSRQTLLLGAPGQLCCAEWVLPDRPLLLGDLPVAWRISARPEPRRQRASWTAYVTTGIPPEAVVALALAADASPDPTDRSQRSDEIVEQMLAAGWRPDTFDPENTVWDPHLTACLTYRTLPEAIEDEDPTTGLPGWQAWAEPQAGTPYLWCAAFSHSTPDVLIAAFVKALTDRDPVIRQVLPAVSSNHLTSIVIT